MMLDSKFMLKLIKVDNIVMLDSGEDESNVS